MSDFFEGQPGDEQLPTIDFDHTQFCASDGEEPDFDVVREQVRDRASEVGLGSLVTDQFVEELYAQSKRVIPVTADMSCQQIGALHYKTPEKADIAPVIDLSTRRRI